MDWKKILTEKFGSKILSAKKINNNLEVVVDYSDSDSVNKISEEINCLFDKEYDDKIDFESLEIMSKGYDPKISWDALSDFKEKKITVKIRKAYLSKNYYEGELIDFDENKIILRWNNKGQFRKSEFTKENIIEMNEYF